MDVAAAHTHPCEIFLQLFRHPFCESRHKYSLVLFGPDTDFLQQVIHLILCRPHFYRRVKETGRPDHLLYDKPFGLLELVVPRSGADIYFLTCDGFEFIKFERPVVRSGREPETVFDEHGFAGMVSSVHRPYLGKGHMALVDECYEILRKIVDEAERAHPFAPAVEISGIVLDTRAVAHLLYHFQVVFHPLLQSLRLQRLSDFLEIFTLPCEVVLDLADGLGRALARGHEIVGRIYGHLVKRVYECSCHRVYDGYAVHLVPEKLDSDRIFSISDADVHGVPADSECPSLEICFSAGIKSINELVEQPRHAPFLAFADSHGLGVEILGIAYAVQA